MKRSAFFFFCFLILSSVFLLSCREAEVFREYQEERRGGGSFGAAFLRDGFSEIQLTLPLKLSNPSGLPAPAGLSLTWQLPPGWSYASAEQQQTASQFRLLTLKTANALEVSLVSFSGEAGGLRANVLRWLGQLQFSPTPREFSEFLIALQPLENPAQVKYYFIDFKALTIEAQPWPREQDLIGGILKFTDETLFIKLSGPTEAIESARPAFLSYLQSLRFREAALQQNPVAPQRSSY